MVTSGCGGTTVASTTAVAVASLALIRGIAIVVSIIVACCGFCFRDRLRACCGCAGRSRRPSQGHVLVQGNPQQIVLSPPGSAPPPGYAAYVQPGYAAYPQQQPPPGIPTYTQSQPQPEQAQAQAQAQAQRQAFAPSQASPSSKGSFKQQPLPMGRPEPFALVVSVTRGSPADLAGLRAGDAVVGLCGARSFESIKSCLAAAEALGAAPPSEVIRGGTITTLFIKPRIGDGWSGRLGADVEEV